MCTNVMTIHNFINREELSNTPGSYAQTLTLVNSIFVKPFSLLVITFQGGGVTTYKFDRIIALFLLCLPKPTRSRNECVRP